MQVKTLNDYKDALQAAIQREKDAHRFYETMADNVHQADQKALLRRLAIEEKGHEKLLAGFAADVAHPPQGAFTPPAYSFDSLPERDLTPEDIFTMAIQLEEESLNFYSRFLVYFFKTGHEDIFRKIFEVELKHKEDLESNYRDFAQR